MLTLTDFIAKYCPRKPTGVVTEDLEFIAEYFEGLQDKNTDLENDKSELEADNEGYVDRINELEKEREADIEGYEDRINELEAENADYYNKIHELEQESPKDCGNSSSEVRLFGDTYCLGLYKDNELELRASNGACILSIKKDGVHMWAGAGPHGLSDKLKDAFDDRGRMFVHLT